MTGKDCMKQACRMIITLGLPLLLCGPALAEQHSGPYVGAYVGGNTVITAKSTDNQGSFNLMYDPAMMGSVVFGWELAPGSPVGEGRVELEYSRRSNRLDKAEFVEGKFKGDGNLTSDSLLINSFGVYRSDSLWTPYAGIGIGAARIEASGLKVTGQPLSNDNALVFAFQLGVGADFALTDKLFLDLGYRFFGSTRPKFVESNGLNFETDYFTHNIILGLRLGF
jgi:opacity protein-like surface antigen